MQHTKSYLMLCNAWSQHTDVMKLHSGAIEQFKPVIFRCNQSLKQFSKILQIIPGLLAHHGYTKEMSKYP